VVQVLYVVELEIRSVDTSTDPYEAGLGSVASWLSFLADQQVEPGLLVESGSLGLTPNRSGAQRSASWDALGSADPMAVRVEVRDEDDESGSAFITRLTLGSVGGTTTVRVSMARESSPTWLSPTPAAELRQPGVIQSLLTNDRIALSIVGQRQDGRYLQVRTDAEVCTLAEALREPSRLPILLVHTRTLPALSAARHAASRLVGLVRVVTLDYKASRALDAELPGYGPPLAGARLVWSNLSAPTISFSRGLLDSDNTDALRGRLMTLIAPESVLARGDDRAYREARRAEISHRDHTARVRTERALAEGDSGAQVEALQAELAAARSAGEEWQQLAADEEQRAEHFQTSAERVPALEARIEQLTVALQAVRPPDPDTLEEEDPWASAPGLVSKDSSSAENLFLYLEDVTSGHIKFTAHAASSWKKSKYPFPGEMTACLVTLARVAVTLYDGRDHSYPHLDTWVKDDFGLNIALQDDAIEKNNNLRYFFFGDRKYDRTPHVKVRDHVPPSQVGRIHFALDPENCRLVVDHVGIKLY
jgi:hypothetical protein